MTNVFWDWKGVDHARLRYSGIAGVMREERAALSSLNIETEQRAVRAEEVQTTQELLSATRCAAFNR
jgi:hypothetical protein